MDGAKAMKVTTKGQGRGEGHGGWQKQHPVTNSSRGADLSSYRN